MPQKNRTSRPSRLDSDSENDDDDFIVNRGRIFPKREKDATKLKTKGRKRKRKEPIEKPETETKRDNSDDSDPSSIEAKAREYVDQNFNLEVDLRNVTDCNVIGWYDYKKKGTSKSEFYPVILCGENDFAANALIDGILDTTTTTATHDKKKIKVQYIGALWKYALVYDEILRSRYVPFASLTDEQNDGRLANFKKTITASGAKNKSKKTKNLSRESLINLKIEEILLRKYWHQVARNAETKRIKNEQEAGTKALLPPMVVTQESDKSIEDGPCAKNGDCCTSDDDDDNDDIDDNHQNPEHLVVNDEIEYYDVMGAFGDPQWLRRATIQGIRPDDSKYPLLLSNSIIGLPASHPVRKLPNQKFFQPIRDFRLCQQGIQSLAEGGSALDTSRAHGRDLRKKVEEASDEFWRNGPSCNRTTTTTK